MKKNIDRKSSVRSHLQNAVEKQFGRNVQTATDCMMLSDQIQKKCGKIISGQTLRRFFHLIPSTSSLGKFTLNLLAEYAGYTDYKDFENSLNKQELEDFFADQENCSTDYWRRSEHLCHQISKSP